jgi:hypothetical protein
MAELHTPKIILFSGKAESGKSTAAGITKSRIESTGYKVAKLAYGDYVKETARMLFSWNGQKDEAGRTLLQWWGTEVVRAKQPNFWVDTVIRLCSILGDMYDYILVDDARYENEITRWRGDVTTVRVERPGHENRLTPEQRAHISETSLDEYPFDVRLSASTRTELEAQVAERLLPKLTEEH